MSVPETRDTVQKRNSGPECQELQQSDLRSPQSIQSSKKLMQTEQAEITLSPDGDGMRMGRGLQEQGQMLLFLEVWWCLAQCLALKKHFNT